MSFNQPVYTDLFAEINGYLKNSDIFREKFNKVLSFDFNVFDFWGRYIDENRMSEILAFFLDPTASHGQNKSFLREFIRYLNEQIKTEINIDDAADVTIILESPTNEKRRMDIHMDIKNRESNLGIVIENKIGADDQVNQIRDYKLYLEKLYPKKEHFLNYHLIYLSPEGDPPTSRSIEKKDFQELKKNKLVSCMSYKKNIIELVSRFISICESDRVRFFLSELSVYLKKRFKGEQFMDDKNEIVEIVCKDGERIRAALEIIQAEEEIKTSLIKKLLEQLRERAKKEGLELNHSDIPFEEKAGFLFTKENWPNIQIEYYFERNNYKSPYIGIPINPRNHTNKELNQNIKDNIIKANMNIGDSFEDSWIWTSKSLPNWDLNSDYWRNIISTTKTCDYIFSIIMPVVEIIDIVLSSE